MRGIQNPSFADKAWKPVLEIEHPRWGMQSPRLSCISLQANRLPGFKYTSRPFSAKFAISFGVSSGYFRTFPFRCLFIDFVLVIRHIKTQHYGSIFCALFSFNWLIRGQPRSSWPTVLLQKAEGRLGDLVQTRIFSTPSFTMNFFWSMRSHRFSTGERSQAYQILMNMKKRYFLHKIHLMFQQLFLSDIDKYAKKIFFT